LLVKMQVINSGDHLWDGASRKPLAELSLTPGDRALLQNAMFVKPLPEVSRAVFICTPHRGSFVAGRTIIEDAVRFLVNPPLHVSSLALDIARTPGAARSPFVPSAIDNMSPHSNFIHALENIPVASDVTVNSIIAVDTDGPVTQGNDGVVQYSSAHIEPVESELVVRSSHSAEGNPHTIEEVRRILRKQAGLE
jgi:transposase InsO family protein